jgi:hypothetical protein
VNFTHRPLAAVFADYFLDEADKGTLQFDVADLRKRSDQFHSVNSLAYVIAEAATAAASTQ